MATSLPDNTKPQAWAAPRAEGGSGRTFTRAELIWTGFGLALLAAFLSLVVDDFPLRTLISVQ